MSDQPTVALLGTGTMGEGMARNIAAAGLPLRVWNRTASRAEPLADVATVAGSVADAVRGADIVVTMLFDADSVAATMEEARGELGDDTVWLQQSTVGVEGSERLAALAGRPRRGVRRRARSSAPRSPPRTAPSSCWPRSRATPGPDRPGARRDRQQDHLGRRGRRRLPAQARRQRVGLHGRRGHRGVPGADPSTSGSTRRCSWRRCRAARWTRRTSSSRARRCSTGSFDPAFALAGALKDADLILAAAAGAGADLGVLPASASTSSAPSTPATATRTWPRPTSSTEPTRWSRCPLVEGRGRAALADARSSTRGR